MTHLIFARWRDRWDEIAVVFANTGFENEATLDFTRQCESLLFTAPVVWVEAVVHPEHRVGTTHRVVDFGTASRKGEPFRAMIEKFGIPNQKFPQCTRELKRRPIHSYVHNELGWENGSYEHAIGIRADEKRRCSATAAENRIIYPLVDLGLTKPDVNLFWSKQSFRLELMGYEGNCQTCWKKSFRKLLTIMQDTPEKFRFFEEMEEIHGLVGPEFKKKTCTWLSPRVLPRQCVGEGFTQTLCRGWVRTGGERRRHPPVR